MPFKSEAQRRWMYANHPAMARRWQAHTAKGAKLPEHVAAMGPDGGKNHAAKLYTLLSPEKRAKLKYGTTHDLAKRESYNGARAHRRAGVVKNPIPQVPAEEWNDKHPAWVWNLAPQSGKLRARATGSLSKVNVSDITSPQDYLDVHNLRAIHHGVKSSRPQFTNPPDLVKHNGKLVVMDGNHRVARALLAGEKQIEAYVHEYRPRAWFGLKREAFVPAKSLDTYGYGVAGTTVKRPYGVTQGPLAVRASSWEYGEGDRGPEHLTGVLGPTGAWMQIAPDDARHIETLVRHGVLKKGSRDAAIYAAIVRGYSRFLQSGRAVYVDCIADKLQLVERFTRKHAPDDVKTLVISIVDANGHGVGHKQVELSHDVACADQWDQWGLTKPTNPPPRQTVRASHETSVQYDCWEGGLARLQATCIKYDVKMGKTRRSLLTEAAKRAIQKMAGKRRGYERVTVTLTGEPRLLKKCIDDFNMWSSHMTGEWIHEHNFRHTGGPPMLPVDNPPYDIDWFEQEGLEPPHEDKYERQEYHDYLAAKHKKKHETQHGRPKFFAMDQWDQWNLHKPTNPPPSKTVTKRDIAREIARQLDVSLTGALPVVQGTLDQIAGALLIGQRVELRNFGVFEMIRVKAQVKRDPRTQQVVRYSPDRYVVRFRPSAKIHGMRSREKPPHPWGMSGEHDVFESYEWLKHQNEDPDGKKGYEGVPISTTKKPRRIVNILKDPQTGEIYHRNEIDRNEYVKRNKQLAPPKNWDSEVNVYVPERAVASLKTELSKICYIDKNVRRMDTKRKYHGGVVYQIRCFGNGAKIIAFLESRGLRPDHYGWNMIQQRGVYVTETSFSFPGIDSTTYARGQRQAVGFGPSDHGMRTTRFAIHLTAQFPALDAAEAFMDAAHDALEAYSSYQLSSVNPPIVTLHLNMPDFRGKPGSKHLHTHQSLIDFVRTLVGHFGGHVTRVVDSTVANSY